MAIMGYPFYTPFYAVGPGKVNSPADVGLIQYMLFYTMIGRSTVWAPANGVIGPDSATADPGPLFPFDGVWKPGLADWIRGFQKTGAPRLGYTVTIDGVINRMPAYWGDTKHPTRAYTIQALNAALLRSNRDAFLKLYEQPDLPALTAADLRVVRLEAFGQITA